MIKKYRLWILLGAVTMLSLLVGACAPAQTPTPTPVPQVSGKTIMVTSTADSGIGTLRQALLQAQGGDTITFDPAVFRPNAPATIYVSSELPLISQGNLTIDASNAGVILDGSNIPEDFMPCLQIISDGNTVQGLQIVNFSPGAGIVLSGGAQNNMGGGDRSIGSGPLGQGNLTSSGDIGIGLWGDGTSFNTVTGNLIGTDTSGAAAWGNSSSGIYISEGACHNTIGPYNIVAHNQDGITICDSNSLGNTVTRNSIHDNEHQGIDVFEGANIELSTPLTIDFDLAAGTVAGTACANCTIEIFSDSSNEGEVYEGQTTAGGTGVFAFDKGAFFTGAHLMATATDADGNTSEFSAPTLGTSRSVILQEGNNLLRTQLQHKQSIELEDNHISDLMCIVAPNPCFKTEQDYENLADNMNQLGIKWTRLSIDWLDGTEVEETGTYSKFYIDPLQDFYVYKLAERKINVIYLLNFWDEEIKDIAYEPGFSRFRTEREIQGYLDYTKFIVGHFKDRIKYYEILNEPNNACPIQYTKLEDYINLIRRVVPVIEDECPDCKVIVGEISALEEEHTGSLEYLLGILNSDIVSIIDGVSWNPFSDVSPEFYSDYYYDYPNMIQTFRNMATSKGFQGSFYAAETNWSTDGVPWPIRHKYSKIASAKYQARGIIMNWGLNCWPGTSIFPEQSLIEEYPFMQVIKNLCNVLAGTRPIDLPVEIQCEATNIRNYSFSLSNGAKLLALWTDGIAIDGDPGIEATLTLPDFSAQKVTGIDVLNGFEQELVTSMEDGSLVIRNLLVKDYPIILRFMP